MQSLTSFCHQDVETLELLSKILAKNVKTVKVPELLKDSSESQNLLSSYAECHLDYDLELLHVCFTAHEKWKLQKMKISFNDMSIKQQSFSDGVESTGMFNTIEFELSIADMTILFYSEGRKNFIFDLTYAGGASNGAEQEVYNTTFSMNLPSFNAHRAWEFRNLLGFYHPSEDITNFVENNFEAVDNSSQALKAMSIEFAGFRQIKTLLNRYESFGYCSMFQRMLSIEDLTVRKALDELSMVNKMVSSTHNPHHFVVFFDGKKLSEKLGFNHLVLTPMSLYEENKNLIACEDKNLRIYNQIIKIDGTRVVFEKPRSKFIAKDVMYHVQLVENRVPLRLAYKALMRITSLNLEPFFTTFDDSTLPCQPEKHFGNEVESIDCINPSIGTNSSQMKAVQNIINRTSFPSPYVVFGPPGTGKTSTLVEAIAQIIKLQPSAKILVTANSNAACDEIGERLLKFVSRYKMYRLYSPSFDISFPDRHMRLHPLLKPISNIRCDMNKYPSYQEFYSYSIIISTLVNCGRMITANIAPTHFEYIFIDECASTIEPLSIIPIASLGASSGRMTAQVVLAGDHKQLQGMVHSYFDEKHGFGISLMERVMLLEKYQFPYDSRLVTQLTDNFRSHWAILRFSNYHFYHSVLRAKQTKEIAEYAIGWDFLPNKCFPLVFHSILAPSEMDGTSLYNNEEVHVVASYVNKLLGDGIEGKPVVPDDIGIICPYGAQRKRLQDRFKNVEGLEIGTVDAFQGREKLIIIMSTVRSQTPTVGFLKNEKRLNVALTRAKALLIVIGNGETLQQNKLWYKFVNYCYQHDAMVGERFMLRYRKAGPIKNVQKPHPMFHMPKVPIVVSESTIKEKVKLLSESESDCETDDDSDWASESLDGSESGSDVSWTFEDCRMKVRTSKLKKWTKVSSLIPRVVINVRQFTQQKNRASVNEKLDIKFTQMRLGEHDEVNNNLQEISNTWSSLKEKIRGIQCALTE